MSLPDRRPALIPCVAALAVSVAIALSGCGSRVRYVRPSELAAAIDMTGVAPAAESYEPADLDHLRYVLDDGQAARYLAATPAARRELMRVVWAAMDPTPTTDRNERREEHYRRLAYVREHFAVKHAPGWDRRGEIFLRYGSPQTRDLIPADIVPGRGLIPPKEVWVYTWAEMAFRVEDKLLQDDYTDASDWIESSRLDLAHGGAASIDMGSTYTLEEDAPTIAAEAAWHRMEKMLGKGWHQLEDNTQVYLHDHGGRKLDFLFDVLSFASSDPERTMTEVNFLLSPGDLAYHGQGDRSAAELDVSVVAKTEDYREVARAEHVLRAARAREAGRVLDRVQLDLEPGDYRLALQVRDRASGNVGIFTTRTTVRDFLPGDLSISDVQLAYRVERAAADSRFVKGNTLVVPNPSGRVSRRGSAAIYFEIYGLGLSRTAQALYTVAITVTARRDADKRGDPDEGVTTEYFGKARSADAQESITLDTAALDPGLWEVEILVTDRVSDRTAHQSRLMRVFDPEEKPSAPAGRPSGELHYAAAARAAPVRAFR